MKLSYSSLKDEDTLILTNFTCDPSQELLNRQGLYKILWNTKKSTSLMIDDYDWELKENEVIFCTPLNVMEVPMDNKGLYAFVFNKQFFCIQTHDEQVSCNGFLFYGSSQPPVIQLENKEIEHFDILRAQFEEEMTVKDRLQGEMLRSLLKRMLIKSTRLAKDHLPQPTITNVQMDTVREYNLLVEKKFRELHQVKDYAKLMFKSPKTLSNLFLKYSDKTPVMVINERIILEAKRLLLYSNKSTDEIAQELGYKNSSHFSKFFKKHEGVSPSILRKNKLAESS